MAEDPMISARRAVGALRKTDIHRLRDGPTPPPAVQAAVAAAAIIIGADLSGPAVWETTRRVMIDPNFCRKLRDLVGPVLLHPQHWRRLQENLRRASGGDEALCAAGAAVKEWILAAEASGLVTSTAPPRKKGGTDSEAVTVSPATAAGEEADEPLPPPAAPAETRASSVEPAPRPP
eukprot:Hpha_TRINITY_DN23269_c0_g1::TRINITY_DN23269_c0_g1_i1::g.30235::m.30235